MSIDAAITELSTLLGNRLSRSKGDLADHGRSETHFAPSPPDAVAFVESTDEVAALVAICAAARCPVTGWGVGTSLEGQALAHRGGVVVDFSRMNKLLLLNAEDMNVVVQPGITREALNTELRAHGLFFPVDPGANASIGGMASTRASGTTTVLYGSMRDNVMALEVVLGSGAVIRTGSQARKSAAGYDLTALMLGSEGTLGLICELTLRLHGQPEAVAAAVCAFDSVEAAVDAAMTTIQLGIPMARIELVDSETVAAINAWGDAKFVVSPHLLVEFHGSESTVAGDARRFGEVAADFGGADFQWSAQAEDRKRLWELRHKAYYACLALRPGARALVTDICVPVSHLAEAIRQTRADIAASSLIGPILGHVGDGNFHAVLLVEPGNASEMAEAQHISSRLAARALAAGGTMTGEHGVGIGKLDYMAAEHGAAWNVMGDIKRALDPQGIMNPGKMVRLN
ncbi:MAG: FAD-binding oxidoreductase [Paracoccaceae bacterium]